MFFKRGILGVHSEQFQGVYSGRAFAQLEEVNNDLFLWWMEPSELMKAGEPGKEDERQDPMKGSILTAVAKQTNALGQTMSTGILLRLTLALLRFSGECGRFGLVFWNILSEFQNPATQIQLLARGEADG